MDLVTDVQRELPGIAPEPRRWTRGLSRRRRALFVCSPIGLGHAQRLVQHQIVAGRRFHGQRRAGERAACMHRPQPAAAGRHARHAVADIGDGQSAEALDDVGPHLS